jgi:hypothetical protein
MAAPRITLLSRPGCHLCDDARAVIRRVAEDLGVAWEERDITRSEDDLREYWEKIPVTLVDGVQHDFWRVSEDRLRAALTRDDSAAGPNALLRNPLRTNGVNQRSETGTLDPAVALASAVTPSPVVQD